MKCGNLCAAAAVKEKELIEKVTVAYKIGSVIRAADVLRIEKSKEDLLLEVEPLRTSADEKKRAVDNLREIMSVADKLHSEENSRAHEEVSNSVKKLMGFPTISEYEIGGILSNLFSLLELNSADVKAAVLDAGIIPFDPSTTPSQSAQQSTRQSREDRFDRGDDDDDEENEHENEADGAFPVDDEKELEVEIEAEVAEVVPITTIEPFHCTLFHYVADTHLKYLCNYKIQGSEENPISQSEEETAATAHIMDNAKSLLLSMLKSRDIYTEVQLLQGYYRMKKSYEGASEFIQSHKELLDPRSCPSAWADSPDVNDLCSLGDTLGKLCNTLKRLSTKDTEPESNVAIAEQELRDAEDKLSITEKDLKEMDDYSEFFEYLALKNKCFDGLDGKFTYNVCILGQLTQRDGDNDSSEVTLGTFSSIDNNPDTGGIIMHFTEGTHCWAFGPRTADVFITCGPEQKMISSNEPTTCYYTFEVESPSGCTENFARINGIL